MRAILALCLTLIATTSAAETLRIATFNASLSRSGPGLLVRDLDAGDDAQILAVAEIIRTVRPDILLINEFDFDRSALAATRFQALLAKPGTGTDGITYPHSFATPPNTGRASGQDLNADGELGGPNDAYGFGRFPGQYLSLIHI